MKIKGQDQEGRGGKMEIEYLQEMLEGQVAVLSSGLLKPKEALDLLTALRKSRMYEAHQNSYMLYPNKELAAFESKNTVDAKDIQGLEGLLEKTGTCRILKNQKPANLNF